MSFRSKHNLDFEVADYPFNIDTENTWMLFRIGTCGGLWRSTTESYDILAIGNEQSGNGHLEDVIQWFEYSCRRDKKAFRILEVWNDGFKKHLIKKYSFVETPGDNLIKYF